MAEKVSQTLRAIRGLESRVATVEANLADLKVDVSDLRTETRTGFILVGTELVAVAAMVREVRDHLAAKPKPDADARLDGLESRVTSLERARK